MYLTEPAIWFYSENLLVTPPSTYCLSCPRAHDILVTFYISQAEKEPILSSFLYASVLSHSCLERSLSFVLANRLQNATLLATQLMDIFDDVMMNDRGIQRSIRLDAQVNPLRFAESI